MRKPNLEAEAAAMRSLAALLHQGEMAVFRGLAALALQLCGAGSAGVSVIEKQPSGEAVFRWKVLAGLVQPYEGGETPRHWSPCGACLDMGRPTLYAYPERHFTYLQALGTPIVEGLVVPMLGHGPDGSTIWIVSHDESRRFDAEDVRAMLSLGAYAARALALPPSTAGARPKDSRSPHSSRDVVWGGYIRQVARGDHSSLDALFQETSPLVFATVLRIVGFPADAEEVTGDVYLRLWNAAASYHPERGSAAGWLCSVARHLAFDHLRSSALRSRHEVELSADYRSATDLDLDFAAGQAKQQIAAALGGLPWEQRQAIELTYLAGLTCPEIAQRIAQPLGTVKTRIRLGLIKLRRLLASAGSFPRKADAWSAAAALPGARQQ